MNEIMGPPPIQDILIRDNSGRVSLSVPWVRFFQDLHRSINTLDQRNTGGIPGRDGMDGEDGYTYPPIPGPTGSTGKEGRSGRDGEDGEDGVGFPIPGRDGIDGRMGVPGVDGEDGEESFCLFIPDKIKNYWSRTTEILDDGEITLPTVGADWSLSCEVILSSAGVIDANAKFLMDSTGTVTQQYDSGNVVYNIDTDTKLCIGTAAGQNPLIIKNRLGGTKNIFVILFYN